MMKKAAALTALVTISATVQAGDPGACYSISDADSRTYCLAKAHHDKGRCYAISDSEKRSECLAELN